jgi:hypothetical protein
LDQDTIQVRFNLDSIKENEDFNKSYHQKMKRFEEIELELQAEKIRTAELESQAQETADLKSKNEILVVKLEGAETRLVNMKKKIKDIPTNLRESEFPSMKEIVKKIYL